MTAPDTGTSATQPAGAAGEGQDSYPTYRDGARPEHATHARTASPRGEKTSASPMLLGLIGFGIVLVIVVLWAVFNLSETKAPADPGNSAAATTTAPDGTAATTTTTTP